jgi:cytochrome c biogenesis protein CcdA
MIRSATASSVRASASVKKRIGGIASSRRRTTARVWSSQSGEFHFARTSKPGYYVGVGLIALGFSLIAYTWGRVAGTLSVALQLPYVISGGLTGLALVVVGATVISVATKRRDAALRARQLDELAQVLGQIASAATAAGARPRRKAGR